MDRTEHIRLLIEKYLDGYTTNAEEQTLRDYFSRTALSDMPAEWRVYKAMFGYVAASASTAIDDVPATTPFINVRILLKIAAAIVVIVTFALWPRTPQNYVVIDGTVYTDKGLMEQNAEEALTLVTAGTDGGDPFDALKLMQ